MNNVAFAKEPGTPFGTPVVGLLVVDTENGPSPGPPLTGVLAATRTQQGVGQAQLGRRGEPLPRRLRSGACVELRRVSNSDKSTRPSASRRSCAVGLGLPWRPTADTLELKYLFYEIVLGSLVPNWFYPKRAPWPRQQDTAPRSRLPSRIGRSLRAPAAVAAVAAKRSVSAQVRRRKQREPPGHLKEMKQCRNRNQSP